MGKQEKKSSNSNKNITPEQYMKEWMDSPMYKKMLFKSANLFENKIGEQRKKNAKNTVVVNKPQPLSDPYTAGDSNNVTGLIRLYPLAGEQKKYIEAHERSHSMDISDKSPSLINNLKDNLNWMFNRKADENRLIPQKDINLMENFSYTDLSVELEEIKQIKNKDERISRTENYEFNKYIAEPTETRARLNDLRYRAKENNIYDPYTQKVTPEMYEKLLENSKKDQSGFEPLNQLKRVYYDEQIIEMLNNVSQNKEMNDRYINFYESKNVDQLKAQRDLLEKRNGYSVTS